MDKAEGQKKIIAIDMLRAFAALGVFFYHNHLGAVIANHTGLSFMKYTDDFGAAYAVPLFFLISGYCIHASNIKYVKLKSSLPLKEYYRRRFVRIYPPYFFALLFALAINHITIPGYRIGTNDLSIHLFSLQGFTASYFNTINIVLWTISIEIAFYAIYPLFYYARIIYNVNITLLCTFVISLISIAYFETKGNISLPEHFFVLNLWFAWCCGAFLADKKMLAPIDLKQPAYFIYYLVILIGCVGSKFINDKTGIIADQFNILFWTGPMLFILSKENWLQKKQDIWPVKVIAAIGLSSYSLYLLHEPLIALKNFWVHQNIPARFQQTGVFIGIIIIPVITWFYYLYIEKPFISKKRVSSTHLSVKNAG